MIVEFTGFAGVGKSYIKKLILDEMKQKEIIVIQDNEFEKVRYFSPFNISLFFTSFIYVYKTKPDTIKFLIKNFIVWYKIQAKLKYYQDYSGIVLIDEGYIHKFRLLRRNSQIKNLCLSKIYNSKFYLPSVICLVTSSLDKLKENVKSRDNKALEITTKDYKSSVLKTVQDIQYLIERNSGVSTVKIDNDASLEINKILKVLNVK